VDVEKSYGSNGINKEFIPIFLILATPVLAYMNGFGIKTASAGVDIYYIAAIVFGIAMSIRQKMKISYIYEFALLIILEIAVNIPYMKADNYFNGNFTYLAISYSLIILFFLMSGISFLINKPYFIDYYRTEQAGYLAIYRIISVFFFSVTVYHVYLFSKVIDILKLTFK
jgi:hypothetical protein